MMGECGSVILCICCCVLDNTDKVVYPVLLVVHDDEYHVSDGVVFPFGLGLDISEVIDVFWDALANEIVLLRVVL